MENENLSSSDENEINEGIDEESSIVEENFLSQFEAANCLHTLGKSDSGLGYAYLGLDVSNRKLTNIDIIPSFKFVLYVDVSGNELTIEVLEILTTMKYLLMLKADRNKLLSAKLSPMPYLQVLTLNKNKLRDTLGIDHDLLERLELSYNKIRIVNFNYSYTKNLKILELRGNKLISTKGACFTNLTQLYLAENTIERLEGLEVLINLKILHLRDNRISNTDGFSANCKNLCYLNLRKNRVDDIWEFKKLNCLPKLETLIVLENPVTEQEPDEAESSYRLFIIAMLPNLKRLDKETVSYDEKINSTLPVQ